MKLKDVLALLESNQDERGIKHWNDRCAKDSGLKSFGIGLTKLRKLAKQVGKNHELALELWQSDIYDAKIIALLIDDPKLITPEQAEQQVEQLNGGYLAHVFSACGTPLAKTPFVQELADKWMVSDNPVRKRCGHGLLYELSKSKKKSAPDDAYFLEQIERIGDTVVAEEIDVQMAMGSALMGMGGRNKTLHGPALKVAKFMGPIDFDPDGRCDPFDVEKHLTSDYIKEKLGV